MILLIIRVYFESVLFSTLLSPRRTDWKHDILWAYADTTPLLNWWDDWRSLTLKHHCLARDQMAGKQVTVLANLLFYSREETRRYEMVNDTVSSRVTSFIMMSEQICCLGMKGKHHNTNFIKTHVLLKNEQMKYGINVMKLSWHMIVFLSRMLKFTWW